MDARVPLLGIELRLLAVVNAHQDHTCDFCERTFHYGTNWFHVEGHGCHFNLYRTMQCAECCAETGESESDGTRSPTPESPSQESVVLVVLSDEGC
jgi:hypothetical protein